MENTHHCFPIISIEINIFVGYIPYDVPFFVWIKSLEMAKRSCPKMVVLVGFVHKTPANWRDKKKGGTPYLSL